MPRRASPALTSRSTTQDVTRTFPEEPYFEEPEVQRRMIDMLFFYSKMNADVGYRQVRGVGGVKGARFSCACTALGVLLLFTLLASHLPRLSSPSSFLSSLPLPSPGTTSRHQGMHELLAAIMLLVDRDSEHARNAGAQAETSDENKAVWYVCASVVLLLHRARVQAPVHAPNFFFRRSFYSQEMQLVMSPEHRDADAFSAFLCLMKDMKPFFEADHYVRPERSRTPPPRVHLADDEKLFVPVRWDEVVRHDALHGLARGRRGGSEEERKREERKRERVKETRSERRGGARRPFLCPKTTKQVGGHCCTHTQRPHVSYALRSAPTGRQPGKGPNG